MRPGEPVYAQVNREKKKNSRNADHVVHPQQMMMHYGDYSEHADHWQQQQQQPAQQHIHGPGAGSAPAGDSWV